MIDDISFNYINEEGNIIKYLIVDKFNFNNKNYILYKEIDKDDLYASYYEIINNSIKIMPILNDEDYDVVDKYLERL